MGYSFNLRCEIQTETGRLEDLVWSQGATPLICAIPTKCGALVGTDAETTAQMMIAPTATAEKWAVVESSTPSPDGAGYLLQWPTVGAHSEPGKPWYYVIYFLRNGHRYWTGSGRLTIEETSATGDGLVWQEIITWPEMVDEVVDAVEDRDFDRLTLNGETITAWPQGGGAETARVVTTATATVEDGDTLILMDTATAGQAQTLTLPTMMEADAATVTVRQLGNYGVIISHGANEYHLTYAGDWVTLDWVAGQGWFWRA